MKKLSILVLVVAMSISAFAEKMAVVNGQKIFATFSLAQSFRKNVESTRAKFEETMKAKEAVLQKSQNDLNAKGTAVTDAEKKKFQADVEAYQKYGKDNEIKMQKEEQARGMQINDMFRNAVTTISKADGFDYAVDSQAVIYGGTDITDKVLAEMEKAAKNVK